LVFEEALKKQPYVLREMIVHVEIRACLEKEANPIIKG
jgi:hypothetical protein